jgi:hypothetical protein
MRCCRKQKENHQEVQSAKCDDIDHSAGSSKAEFVSWQMALCPKAHCKEGRYADDVTYHQ